MTLHRQNADLSGLDSGSPWRIKDLGFVVFGLFFFAGCIALGAALDSEREPAETVSAAQEERARLEQAQRLRDAYAAGQREAWAAMKGTTSGLQLAQACRASGFWRQP